MYTWLVVGSGPSAPDFLQMAQAERPDKTITCNYGTELIPDPNYYLLYENLAIELFKDHFRAMREQHGTKLVAPVLKAKRPKLAFKTLRAECIIEHRAAKSSGRDQYRRGHYLAAGFAGSLMVQFALENKAHRLLIVGMEGYRSKPNRAVVDTFHGRKGLYNFSDITQRIYAPIMRQIVAAWPEVDFVFYGPLSYEIDGPNVTKQIDPIYPVPTDEDGTDDDADSRVVLHDEYTVPQVRGAVARELQEARDAALDPGTPGPGNLAGQHVEEGPLPVGETGDDQGSSAVD